MAVRNRALTIATRGILSAAAVTIATHGLIQLPTGVAPPVEVEPPAQGGGLRAPGERFVLEYPARYEHRSVLDIQFYGEAEFGHRHTVPADYSHRASLDLYMWGDASYGADALYTARSSLAVHIVSDTDAEASYIVDAYAHGGLTLDGGHNEGDGHEVVFLKKFEGDNDTNWEVGFMLEDWGTLASKQIWAGGTNIFASQPNAYVWAGKVFHSRLQSGLNDYFITINDGAGTGVKGLDLGFANLELGAVTNDQSNYLVTSKLSDIKFGEKISLDFIANYGFANNTVEDDVTAFQFVTVLKAWGHNFYYRYADNVGNSLSWGKEEGLSSHYLSFEGSQSIGEKSGIEYLAAFHAVDKADDSLDNSAYTLIVRPTHQWNDIHSTWLEFGYGAVDFDNGGDISGYKATFSQNIAVGGVTWARPQIRFYVTAGQDSDIDGNETTPVIVGTMFEAWW